MANKIDKVKLLNTIKALSVYQGYNFDDFIGVQTMTVSKKVICNRGHEYTNSLSKLQKGPRCKKCAEVIARILSDQEYALLLTIKDIYGNTLILEEQDGERRRILPNDENVPGRAEKITIACKVHGNFKKSISELLRVKDGENRGCPKCINKGAAARRITIDEFIERAYNSHKKEDGTPKYDYSESILRGMEENITIRCPNHGYFTQLASSHVNDKNNNGASGCPKCGFERTANALRHTKNAFVNDSKNAHKNPDGSQKYNYDKSYVDPISGEVKYTTVDDKVCITCPIHGDFWQMAYDHMSGKRGCTYCHESEGENTVWLYLKSLGIIHTREQKFDGMVFVGPLRLDFYLNNFNAAIEFNGEQHYHAFSNRGGEKGLMKTKIKDEIKSHYCETHGIPLLVIKYNEDIVKKIDEFLPKLVKI